MTRKYAIVFCLVMLASASLADIKLTSDITRLGVGARPLGMGKTFTGIADDISAMYLNPGGLAHLDNLQVLSMSGKFVNAVNYLTFAGTIPTRYGTVGIGYSGAGLGFSTPVLHLVEIATGEYRVIPSSNEAYNYNYNNYVIGLAYGTTVFRPDLSVGAVLKFFNESISGSSNDYSHGQDLDIGLMFRPVPNITLGALGKNLLPYSWGGKVRWNTGQEESLPASVNLGASVKLDFRGDLNLAADYEYKPTQGHIPALLHTGIEWWPTKIFAVRGGIDQDVVGSGSGTGLEVTSNPTAGISLNAGSFRFDYAYHRYNDIAANDTHYFSLLYSPEKLLPLEIAAPKDRLITDEVTVMASGRVRNPNIKTLRVNDIETGIKDGKFEQETSLMPGKNTLWVAGLDRKGKVVESKRLRVLRLVKFTDIPADFWAKETVQVLGTLDIMPAYSDGSFRPDEKIDRYRLLLNLLNIDRVSPATELKPFPFKDVKLKDKIAPYLKAGYNEKLILGYPDRTFRPWQPVTRLEGIMMAVRFSEFEVGPTLEKPYPDVSARHWGINEVNAAKEKSMLSFVDQKLEPGKQLTRAELAAILSKTPQVSKKIKDLFDFEKGYETNYPY
jgi:hypothetical protein